MDKIRNWTRCVDKSKNPAPPCFFAGAPYANGVLSVEDMAKLGYTSCFINFCNYLANADRPCIHYKEEK